MNYMELEYPSCPLCHSENRRYAYSRFETYKVVGCCSCGFYYLYPRLTETAMFKLYADDSYFEGDHAGYTSYSGQEVALRTTFQRLMINLKKNKLTGGSLLEIGCGYGYLLDEARKFFTVRVGTDFSERATKLAASKADFIYCGGIEQVPIQEKFDLIIATHVIEHVYQPQAFVKEILKHLKPGGSVVIATPDMGSFWRYLMAHKWPSFKLPEHVLYFDKRSLSVLMKQAGLANVKPLPYPHAFPLPLVTAKLGVKLPSRLSKFNLWMPATTLALYGKFYA